MTEHLIQNEFGKFQLIWTKFPTLFNTEDLVNLFEKCVSEQLKLQFADLLACPTTTQIYASIPFT